MKTRILLSEMTAVADELIQLEQLKSNNGHIILSKLKSIGVSFTKIDNWTDVEAEFTKDYPKATLQFNLQANGVEPQYLEAEAFYLKNRQLISFEAVALERIEEIKEKCKVYADSPAQIEAHTLITNVAESLNRLIEMGIKIDVNQIYQVSRLFYGDPRNNPPLRVNQTYLVPTLTNLK